MGDKHRVTFRRGVRGAAVCGAAVAFVCGVALGAGPMPEDTGTPSLVLPPPALPVQTPVQEREEPKGSEVADAAPVQAAEAAPTDSKPIPTPSNAPAPAIESQPLGMPRETALVRPSDTKSSQSPVAGAVKTVGALGLVVAMILGAAWGVRRAAQVRGGLASACGPGGRAPSGVLSVLGRFPIAKGQVLVLLHMDRRVLLVAQTSGRGGSQLTTLSEITDPDEIAALLVKTRDTTGESISHRFRTLVERLNQEPPERAVTVVPPVKRADWFERGTKQNAAADAPAKEGAIAASGARPTGAEELRLRLSAMRGRASA